MLLTNAVMLEPGNQLKPNEVIVIKNNVLVAVAFILSVSVIISSRSRKR